ncbi:hypothetical protein Peur_019864 [Populus x canadensis]
MAADLIKMQLKENNIKDLEDRQYIQSLTQMLNSNSPAYKSAILKCIKKLLLYPQIVKQLLSDSVVIPLLLGLISFVRSDSHLKQEAGEILALLVGACQHPEFEINQGRKELQSEHNREVKRWVLKLISCISDNHPDGVPLPPSPSKETAINTLVSLDIEERSIAAAIISQLPKDDIIIDELLKKSEALKAIREKRGPLVRKMRSCEPRNPTVLYKAVHEKRNTESSDLRGIGGAPPGSRKFKKAVEKHGSFRVFFLSFFPSSLLVVMDKDMSRSLSSEG